MMPPFGSKDIQISSCAIIYDVMYSKAGILPNSIGTLSPDEMNLFTAFRVRTNVQANADLIRSYSYPCPECCLQNGRANVKGKSVFYCSGDKLTAIRETIKTSNDIVFLGEWALACNREVNYTSFIPVDVPNRNPLYLHAQTLYAYKLKEANRFGIHEASKLKILFNYVAGLFVKETSPYSLTSWISDNTLYGYDGIDFIIYPSYISSGISCNFVFHPNFVDKYMALNKIYKIQTIDKGDSLYKGKVIEVGKIIKTHVKWISPSEQDREKFPLEIIQH